MSLTVAVVGCGSFAQSFIPLFKAHPLVDGVALCDVDARKLGENAARHGIGLTFPSLDAACDARGIDAVALFTQNWLHGPQAVRALCAGKHVYSAVPAGVTVDEIRDLVAAASASDRIYMLGETSYYYPGAIYCRQQLAAGAFGHVAYVEGEYYHDWDHGLYDVMKSRAGDRWREFAGGPPMHYPTHSVGQVLSVLGGRMTSVSCLGFRDRSDDGIYDVDVNRWGNPYSNETGLFRHSGGAVVRINEFRRVGHPGREKISLFGTRGTFQDAAAGKAFVTKENEHVERLDELLSCRRAPKHEAGAMDGLPHADAHFYGFAPIHEAETRRLPTSFIGLTNGHQGSHQLLVDDFVTACATSRQPPNHVWAAARYVLPGLIAHESATLGGELLDVPDFGDGPQAP
jgi:predicted dehydrogenase